MSPRFDRHPLQVAPRLLGATRLEARTIAIEVGMQNSGLGVVLARKHFVDAATGVSLAAVPCAISSVFHSVIGSVLAGLWRRRGGPMNEADSPAQE